ncbi:MAG: hypothetical protein N2578_04700 [Bdellovibrionaceae bacterium]|nr:hypothetical protein [Pseudobdellovibrionaceae bacterium]
MKMLLRSLLLSCLWVSLPALSMMEFRANYGTLGSSPDLGALYSGGLSLPAASVNSGLGFDALFIMPIVGLGGGLRYEALSSKFGSDLEIQGNVSRTALLVNWRIINTLLYVGPIVSIGLSHGGRLKFNASGTTVNDWVPGSASSTGIGLEVGAKLAGLLIGAEGGYQTLEWKDSKDEKNPSSATKTINMGGPYLKVSLGFELL